MQALKLMDYHLHTAVTVDGRMDEITACERALSLGIQEIAFTNHVMLNQPDYTMTPSAFIDHWEKILNCQYRYPQLVIRLGIEMDYYPGREAEIAVSLENYQKLIGRPFDFILGSVHELSGCFFSNKNQAPGLFKDNDLVSLYCAYFDLVAKAVRSRMFDVIAHPDLIKKYSNELTPPLPFDSYISSVEPFIDALIDERVGLEVNTKGLKLLVKEAYPSNELLKLYLSKSSSAGSDLIITLGSDAHKVEDVGFGITETAVSLRNLGFPTLTRFDKREKTPYLIDV